MLLDFLLFLVWLLGLYYNLNMTIHLKKLAVGINSIEILAERQKMIIFKHGLLIHITRNKPKRENELVSGGSIFWIIKRQVCVRQRILSLKDYLRDDGKKSTGIILENKLIRVRPTSMRPFQGWRYYSDEEIPPDIDESNFSDEFNSELSKLGLY